MESMKTYSIKLPPELKAKVDQQAKKKRWSFSQTVRVYLETAVKGESK